MIAPIIVISICLVLMVISISFNWKIRIKNITLSMYWLFCLLGAIICLVFGFAGNWENVKSIFFSNANINPLKILVIFLSCTSISVLLDKIGFFSYIASIVLKKAKASQTKLFFSFSAIIAVLTIFTSNDILILTFTPFICYFVKHAKIDATPYIVAEFACANVWSMFFLIGNPTNIYLGTTFGISFMEYAGKMILPTLVCGIVSNLIVYLVFRKKLQQKISVDEIDIPKPNKHLLWIGLSGLTIMVLLMAISSYIGLELWYIPLACSLFTYLATIVCILIKKLKFSIVSNSLKSLPYALIPFLLSMSIFIASLDNVGAVNWFAKLLTGQHLIVLGLIAFLTGNLLNNIPMTMMFSTTLLAMTTNLTSVYAVIASSNVCALLTPIGSLAGIMFINILKQNDINFKFKHFVKYGVVISIPTILFGLLTIFLI